MHLRIIVSIIFTFSLFAFSLPVFAQKVLQCAPMKVTVNNDLEVKNDLLVDNKAIIANDLTVNKDIFAASGSQKIYLGPDIASPYISNNLNGGEGILFKSNGGQNFLWQSPNGSPGSDAMILRAGGGLPTNNQFNLQVFGQVSSYQLHTLGIHLDMQGGIGPTPKQNILRITNSDNTGAGSGAAIFHGANNWQANTDDNLIFSGLTNAQDIGVIGLTMNTVSGNVGIRTVNPQITLAVGDNDTGLKWNADGNFSLTSNNTWELSVDPGNVRVRNNLSVGNEFCLGGVCKSAWPAAAVESDPIWTTASANYYTTTNLQTSGQASVLWGNLTGVPAGLSDGDQVGLTAVAWGDVSGKPAICPIGQFVTDISAGTCAVPPAAAAESDTLNTVTGRGNTTVNAITVGGLTVDTNTLYVDSVNNRVGIGTLAPSYELDIGATNGRIRLQNPTAVLTSYITAGSSETSTGKIYAVAIKDSLWVTQNAFIDGNLSVSGNTTLGDAITDITTVNGDICIGFLCIKYLASRRIYCDSAGSCDDQPNLPGCESSVGVMPNTVHLSKGVKASITDYYCKWKGGAITGYDDCEGGGSDESYSDYECRYIEVQ